MLRLVKTTPKPPLESPILDPHAKILECEALSASNKRKAESASSPRVRKMFLMIADCWTAIADTYRIGRS